MNELSQGEGRFLPFLCDVTVDTMIALFNSEESKARIDLWLTPNFHQLVFLNYL